MTDNGKKRIDCARKILGEVTTHDLDNLEQAQMLLNAMRLLREALEETGKENAGDEQ